MATGPENYREAERMLTLAAGGGHPVPVHEHTAMVATAQVHATLALAAATAEAARNDVQQQWFSVAKLYGPEEVRA